MFTLEMICVLTFAFLFTFAYTKKFEKDSKF